MTSAPSKPAADLINTLTADYQRFPKDQTYSLYAEDVFFKDPMVSFRGVAWYRRLIQFMDRWFLEAEMTLHEIRQTGDRIDTVWTLRWIAPAPWKPQMSISGRSILQVNSAGLIQSHIDEWDCSRWDVLRQLF
ncbi:MAG TPA: DUF2358 domain-containing protein [Stenomitos sp.]